MNKTESIRISRGLRLYKQPKSQGRGSPNWYACVYMPINGRNLHTLTTGTTDVRLATKKAEDFRADCILWSRGVIPMPVSLQNRVDPAKRFDNVVDAFIDAETKEAGNDPKKLRNLIDKKSACFGEAGFAAFFGKVDISEITTERIREFLRHKEQKSKKGKLAPATMKRALIELNQIFKYAAEKRLITTLPILPKVKQQDSPRAWFSLDEYRTLHAMCRKLAKEARQAGDGAEVEAWREMEDFVVFMVNSFLRSSEWGAIQNKHVEMISGVPGHLRVAVTHGKTKPRFTSTMPRAAEVYHRIRKRIGDDPDAHLFLNGFKNRKTASERMRDRFEVLLTATKLKHDSLGKVRVIHSLRHSALMFRVLHGVDLHLLATNAGTSIDQLERFYCSHFQADMKIDELHKMKAG